MRRRFEDLARPGDNFLSLRLFMVLGKWSRVIEPRGVLMIYERAVSPQLELELEPGHPVTPRGGSLV